MVNIHKAHKNCFKDILKLKSHQLPIEVVMTPTHFANRF